MDERQSGEFYVTSAAVIIAVAFAAFVQLRSEFSLVASMHECVSFCTITLNRLETFMTDFKGFADEYREKKQELDAFHATYNGDE
ncbi:hypothetical protein T05_10269 [Trichinella murrelli]|uniref:Uncharacterized protein n=1 Tax=Trichinella murrelli TaxID=144512 RepID=A0A0V0TW24_9BILA|nr:hypothetical protein T05_10269 [Trichinella murrelli]